jgi:hypothetical protein
LLVGALSLGLVAEGGLLSPFDDVLSGPKVNADSALLVKAALGLWLPDKMPLDDCLGKGTIRREVKGAVSLGGANGFDGAPKAV